MKFITCVGVLCCLLMVFLSMIFSSQSAVLNDRVISKNEVITAKKFVEQLKAQVQSQQQQINISLNSNDLALISLFITQALPQFNFQMNLLEDRLYLVASYQVKILSINQYLNLKCLFVQSTKQVTIDECSLGKVLLPKRIIELIILQLLENFSTSEQKEQYIKLYQKITIDNHQVNISAHNLSELKANIQNVSKQLLNVNNQLAYNSSVDNQKVLFYINVLENMSVNSSSLSPYIIELFKQVEQYRSDDILLENKAALWALIIVFANDDFSKYIGLTYQVNKRFQGKRLAKRRDLALHFLYSIFLELIGKKHIATKVGEFKELLDSNKGGSGFSFIDLAADFAGVEFSKRLTNERLISKKILLRFAKMNNNDEALIFPSIQGLPEGISQKRFIAKYGHTPNDAYHEMTKKIYQRIEQLYIYQ